MKRDLIILGVLLVIFLGGYFGLKYFNNQNQQKILDAQNQVQEVEKAVSDIEKKDSKINNNEKMTEQDNSNKVVTRSYATIKTNMGDIKVELYDDLSPKTVENFLKLANSDFYDGILFHRVIPDFMIQAGDPLTKEQPKNWAIHGTGGPGYAFDDEFNNEPLVKGSLAMANAGPNTNGSQFFIVTAPATPWLDGKHTNFGKVIEGMDVVEAIQNVQRNERDHPLEDVKIIDIEVGK